jgi:Ras-related protein Rab-7A
MRTISLYDFRPLFGCFSRYQNKKTILRTNDICRVGKTSLLNRYSTGKFTGQYKATIGADFLAKDIVLEEGVGGSGGANNAAADAANSDFYYAQNSQRMAVSLQIWDTAGQERFQSLGHSFYRGSDGAVLVYDVTDSASLEHLQHWKDEFLDQIAGTGTGMGGANASPWNSSGGGGGVPFPFVVLGNKCDKERDRRIPRHVALEWCRNGGTSSSSGIGGTHPPHIGNSNHRHPQPLVHLETSAKTALNVDDAFVQIAKAALQYEEYRRQTQPQLFVPPPFSSLSQPIDLRREESSYQDYGNSNGRNDQCC